VLSRNSPVSTASTCEIKSATRTSWSNHRGTRADLRRASTSRTSGPECFLVERKLRERMKIPVFHDDHTVTRSSSGPAILNRLRVVRQRHRQREAGLLGAGAAASPPRPVLVSLGLKMENIWVFDIRAGGLPGRRKRWIPNKARYAAPDQGACARRDHRGCDVFRVSRRRSAQGGPSVAKMAGSPADLALANPEPEILPDAPSARDPTRVVATGRRTSRPVNRRAVLPFILPLVALDRRRDEHQRAP